MNEDQPSRVVRRYFVDEAGDPVLFDRRGQIIVGAEGCSSFFMLGYLDISNADLLSDELNDLRAQLLADPYFRGVPSMQLEQRKTALAFHAKDDVPEVRREVFRILSRHELRFYAVVQDKRNVAEMFKEGYATGRTKRYSPDELYDNLVEWLFSGRVHEDDIYHVVFARRGARNRTVALSRALQSVQLRGFSHRIADGDVPTINVEASTPVESTSLQAVDYFLWALQRLYERQEERYLALLWSSFRHVYDLGDRRESDAGAEYSQKRPLSLAALQSRLPGI